MGYISELREYVGTRPLIGVGATIIVWDSEGRILLQHRSDTNNWGIPGGAMEPGETMEDTARRELYEETGLEAGELKLLDVLSGPEFFFQYPNGDQLHGVIVLYEATSVSGELRANDDESKDLAYFSLESLPDLESRAAEVIRRLPFRQSA